MSGADAAGFVGGPPRVLDLGVHAWSSWSGDQRWDIAAKALNGTRRHYLDDQLKTATLRAHADRRKAWNSEQSDRAAQGKRPLRRPSWWDGTTRLSAAKKAEVQARMRPLTVMDYLYRLRIRANYEDELMFSEGPTSDEAAAMWARNLVALTTASLLVHELRLVHLLGRHFVLAAADEWLSRHATNVPGGLAQRRSLLTR